MRKPNKRPTIIDVAEYAGVSAGTASRVLNNVRSPPETRRRVQDAVDALKYVPNHLARNLKRQSTEQIALVVPDIANPAYVAMAKSVQQTAKERGYRLSLVSTDGNSSEETYAIQSLEQKHVDGLIMCSLQVTNKLIKDVEAFASRVCVIGEMPDTSKVDNVRVDSLSGAVMAVQHLADQGRHRIGFVNGTADTAPASSRYQGYKKALFDNYLPFVPELVTYADFTMIGGYTAVDDLVRNAPDLDAIFCANDLMALGVLRRLRELDRDVPSDIALVGVDDIESGKVSTPTLTSVSLLSGERGRIAVELLLDRLTNTELAEEPRKVTVMPRLIIRESSTEYLVPARSAQISGKPRKER